MRIAIEKESPITGGAVFVTNLVLVIRTAAIIGGFAFAYVGDRNKMEWLIAVGIVVTFLGAVGYLNDCFKSVATRRGRYQGVLVFMKNKKWEETGKGLEWLPTLSPVMFKDSILHMNLLFEMSKIMLEKISEEDRYVQFVLTINDENEIKPRLIHHCNDGTSCHKPEIHLFGYNELRDGKLV